MNRLDKFVNRLDDYSDLVLKLFVLSAGCVCLLALYAAVFGLIGAVVYNLILQGGV